MATDAKVVIKEVSINAPLMTVWRVLTDPEYIKRYMYGTRAISDWKKGSSLRFVGTWEGVPYEDKGTILTIEAGKVLEYSYWSSFTGVPDEPANYAIVRFELYSDGGRTRLQVSQRNSPTQKMQEHSESGWIEVLKQLAALVENENNQ